jgi:hypothetical protein
LILELELEHVRLSANGSPVFFFNNKSANNTFNHGFSAKQTNKFKNLDKKLVG